MPHLHRDAPRRFAAALAAATAVVVALALVGLSAPALLGAALVVPTIVVVAQRDADVWDTRPGPALAGTVGVGVGLGVAVTLVWSLLLGDDTASWTLGAEGTSWSLGALLVACLAVPVVGELLRQTGPARVTARPRFDDLLDRTTFGLATGATWAAAESLVLDRSLITGGGTLTDLPVATAATVLAAGIVTPLGLAAATALATTAFPGLRTLRAHAAAATANASHARIEDLPRDQRRAARRRRRRQLRARTGPLWRRYGAAVGEAVVYGIGLHLARAAGAATGGTSGSAVWLGGSLTITVVAVLRLRLVLHHALLDAAWRAHREGRAGRHAPIGDAWCGHCDAQLVPGAAFCWTCGMATRAADKRRRAFNRDPHTRLIGTGSTPLD